MAPKKGKGKAMDSVDGVDTSKMSREQLELYSHKILEEMEREREERNFFQLERDKLRTFWEITRHRLEEVRATLRNKEREKEELMEKHEAEIKLYKQKIKHLMYEHQTNLSETKAEHMVALKISQDNHDDEEKHLINDKKILSKTQKEQELASINEIRNLKLRNAEEKSELIRKFQSETMELENKYEEKLMAQHESLILKNRMEICEVEERKNLQISHLIKNHEKAFADMKSYYNDITLNNISLIQSLKEQMTVTKNSEDHMKKQVRELTAENKKLSINCAAADEQITELNRQLVNYEKDKTCLINAKKRLAITNKDNENLKWENEALELKFEKCRLERDDLHAKFVSSILELQQKTGLKNILLEKKIAKLSDLLEQREIPNDGATNATDNNSAAVITDHSNNTS